MNYAKFETLLKQVIGLDVASIGRTSVEHAVQSRLSALKLIDTSRYWEIVSTSATERQELIEAVVVPETWFFRDREAFEALARIALEEWLPTHPAGTLRLLSLPCSSGEEPYSMAIALLDAGFPPSRYRVDAVDISSLALDRARRAVYGKNSFRGADLTFRDRHFTGTPQGYQLSEIVCQQVHYQPGNLFDADSLAGVGIYDIVFCRNLLIYFDRPDQDRAVGVLQRLLTPEGALFVGPSEAALLLSHEFTSRRIPLAFSFRKGRAVLGPGRSARTHPIKQPAPSGARTPPLIARRSPNTGNIVPTAAHRRSVPVESGDTVDASLNEASNLADQGRLTEAAQSCEEHLRTKGPSLPALHLMGLIHAAAGDLPAAARYYRKALYLDPLCHDTLLHLGLLLEKQGDATGARVIRNRMLRVQKMSGVR